MLQKLHKTNPNPYKTYFKNIQGLLKIFTSRMKQVRAGANREHGRQTLEYPYGILI